MEKYSILYEDEDIIITHKHSGISVETAKIGEKDLVTELKKYLKRSGNGSYLGVIHRLDQPVEGVLVFAKNNESASKLSSMAASKDGMDKIYTATVYGRMPCNKGVLEDYLIKDMKSNTSKVTSKTDKAKKAKLEYEVISKSDDTEMLRIKLHTGRHHQIRVQLSHAGCPIVGDLKYGTKESIAYSKDMSVRNIELVAARLSFVHPRTGKLMDYSIREGI